MKKRIILLLCSLGLCLAATAALADGWDFLHSVIRLSATADVQRLAAENGLTLSRSEQRTKREYHISGLTIAGLTPKAAVATQYRAIPMYNCMLFFDAGANSAAQEPGPTYAALFDALTAQYGQPAQTTTTSDIPHAIWKYKDLWISLYWKESRGVIDFPHVTMEYDPYIAYEWHDHLKYPPFPYPITEYAARAFAETKQPFLLRNGIRGGMTTSEVIMAEGKAPSSRWCTEAIDCLSYEGVSIDGRDATITYTFERLIDGEAYDGPPNAWLIFVDVVYTAPCATEAAYIADYHALNQELPEKYGPDCFGDDTWYVPDTYKYGGYGSEQTMCTVWPVRDVAIAHILGTYGSEYRHGIKYSFLSESNIGWDIDNLSSSRKPDL